MPDALDATTTYEYLLTVSADNAVDATAEVTVKVLNLGSIALVCTSPPLVYEGSEDFALDCSATGAPAGSEYAYVWTARGSTANTHLLIAGADGPAPTFDVPEEVDEDETYEYLLTVSAENAVDATAEVTVKVLNLGSIALVCASPPLVYEGSEDFALDCSVSGDTGDVDYAYEWAAIGATPNTSRLSAADIPSPTFYVPDALDETTTYEYLLTASADNAEDAAAEVTVTVLNKRARLLVRVRGPLLRYTKAIGRYRVSTARHPVRLRVPTTRSIRTPGRLGAIRRIRRCLALWTFPPRCSYVPDEVDEDETYEYTADGKLPTMRKFADSRTLP